MNRDPNLVLIGFMAAGKSTVGRDCARILGLRFRDSDRLVEQRSGKSIPEIFSEGGEAVFRSMEASAIQTLASANPLVLSTGGGAPMDTKNVARLRRTGLIVLLWARPEVILSRISNPDTRPLLVSSDTEPAERVSELLAVREPAYRAAADVVIDTTSLSRPETVARVVAAYYEGKTLRRFRRKA